MSPDALGWRLSPAFDINPSVDKNGLALNIDTDNNELNYSLAQDVGEFFLLDKAAMKKILDEVRSVVRNWRKEARTAGIPVSEQDRMSAAFKV